MARLRARDLGLAIFQPVEHYVSPNWYPSKQDHGRVVPTWNYIAIHVYGRLEVIQDPELLREIVDDLTERFENDRAAPWRTADAPDDYIAGQLKGIIGLRLKVERIEAKTKLSQNKSAADRAGVAAGLREDGGDAAGIMAGKIETEI